MDQYETILFVFIILILKAFKLKTIDFLDDFLESEILKIDLFHFKGLNQNSKNTNSFVSVHTTYPESF